MLSEITIVTSNLLIPWGEDLQNLIERIERLTAKKELKCPLEKYERFPHLINILGELQ